MKRMLAILTSAVLLFGTISVWGQEEQAEKGLKQDLVVLFTSDVHCAVAKGFGLDGLWQIRKAFEDEGNYTLLVDDGDFIQGEPIGLLSKGEALTDLMNEVGYDIAIPGNHEFDYGIEQFLNLAQKAEFPYISANINRDGKLIFPPYVIKEYDGVKFAFVGVTTPKTLASSNPKRFQDKDGNTICDFYQGESGELFFSKVQEAVDSARTEGADYVLAICHLGNEDAAKPYDYVSLIKNTTGIDVVMDGHSHDTASQVIKNKDGKEVPRAACGTKLSDIGTVTIKKNGSIKTALLNYNLPMPAQKAFALDNPISRKLNEIMGMLSEWLDLTAANTSAALVIRDPAVKDENGAPVRIVRSRETNLGDFYADAVRSCMGADVGIVNGGGIRDELKAGDITYAELLAVAPFGNMMSLVEITGQQLLDVLEWGARMVPEEYGGR
ncbi:MAG: bifunctional metallophosphatase/5'-nucleotidase [Lachnospiraceae bacterium]|nr:bifunctional metallophosphatase/5'-nucleotidase [Lachnospiraceae bacterium]